MSKAKAGFLFCLHRLEIKNDCAYVKDLTDDRAQYGKENFQLGFMFEIYSRGNEISYLNIKSVGENFQLLNEFYISSCSIKIQFFLIF